MTNYMIVLLESVKLMEQGILAPTGEIITIQQADGTAKELQVPEPIYTYTKWKELGYHVKRGEHAIAKFPIWKYKKGRVETEADETEQEGKGRMFLKMSHFFRTDQVERIVSKK